MPSLSKLALVPFALCATLLLVLTPTAHASGPGDYLAVVGTLLGFDGASLVGLCGCVIEKVNSGQCNNMCGVTGCASSLQALYNCTEVACPGLCVQGLAGALQGNVCATQGTDLYFPPDQPVCSASPANLDDLFGGSLSVADDVRASCTSLDSVVASGQCDDVCTASTCDEYLTALQSCADKGSNTDCSTAVSGLRNQVDANTLTCQQFRANHTCELHTAGNSYTQFSELIPAGMTFAFDPSVATECSCLNVTECGVCDSATTSCQAINDLLSCAETTSACSSTNCVSKLTNINNLVSNTTCSDVNNTGNCTQAFGTGVFSCQAFTASTCALGEAAISNGANVPAFLALPTPSNTPSTSLSPSFSPSASLGAGATVMPGFVGITIAVVISAFALVL